MSITHWENRNLADIDEMSAEFVEMEREAHNGTHQAQHAMGMWYEVHGNLEKAEKWYKLAQKQGYAPAEQACNDIITN